MPSAAAAAPSDPHAAVPVAPDFGAYPPGDAPVEAQATWETLTVVWADGLRGAFNRFWLRETETHPDVIHPETRERNLDVADLPEELAIESAALAGDGVRLRWAPDGRETLHAGPWLRAVAERVHAPGADMPEQTPWTAAEMPEPPTFDGPAALRDPAVFEAWLRALGQSGFARLRNLEDADGLVLTIAERIGVVRPTSFGRMFTVASKPNPDSNAYTAGALTGHTDLPTRELQPGLQMLHCRENTCTDGSSTMADGFAVGEALRQEDPDAFEALTTLRWIFTNRHADLDYRQSRPILACNAAGRIVETAYSNALRLIPDMADADAPRAYRAVRLFQRLIQSDRFICRTPFAPGDLVIFDNRRILHGRDAFNPQGGRRRLEGCYLDHDDLFSTLRVLARRRRAAAMT